MEPTGVDAIDHDILAALSKDGRLTWLALADTVGLSPSATTERVRRLERRGAITGYHAHVSAEVVGRPLEAWVAVTLEAGADRARFLAALRGEPAIVDGVHLTGAADYELRVRCRGTEDLDLLLNRLKDEHAVATTHTRIVLSRVLGDDDIPFPARWASATGGR